MTNLMKRSLALVMALVLCLSLLPATAVPVNAADYIYNWGTRGTIATSLSENAQAFYTGNNTYDALSAQAGGTSTSNVPNSALYDALQNLMADAHSYKTSYDATKELYQYTDCENGGGKISSFYSGAAIGPDWDGGKTWNREHTWPNSKGLNGADENDIMMLRPTSVSENSSRGNTAYGESAGYYNPNGTCDVRGDVARIFLYVYVRWGNVNGNGEYTTWGTNGVIESPEVMLKWMAEDPVDTWEMGRNDSVQSITGTRNVFVDYPELAFLLFGEEIPSTMTTPSGNTAPHQHNYVDGVCSGCGATEAAVEETPATGTYEKATSIAVGDTVVLVYESKKMELSAISTTSTKYGVGVAYSGVPTGEMPLEVVTGSGGPFAFKTPDGKYLYWTSGNSLNVNTTLNAKTSWNVTFDENGNAVIKNAGDSTRQVYWNSSSPRFACYNKAGQQAVQLYKFVAGSTEGPACEHANTTLIDAVAATCTTVGYTGNTVCADCNETVIAGQEVPVSEHTYVDGICSGCGLEQLNLEKATSIAIGDRVTIVCESKSVEMKSFNGTKYAEGIAYSDIPVGVYTWTIVAGATEGTYAFQNAEGAYMAWSSDNTLKTDTNLNANSSWNVTFDEDGNANIINGAESTRQIKWNASSPRFACYTSGQTVVQLYKAVSASTEDPNCEHTNKTTITVDATCGNAGSSTEKCEDCGEVISSVAIPATGAHNHVNYVCTVCGNIALPEADSTLTLAQAAAIGAAMDKDAYTEGKYYVTGKITEIANTTYGNMTIEDETGTLYIYGVYSADGSVRYDALETKPVVGDTVTLYGIIGKYNDAQMKNGWITGHEALNCEHTSTTVVGAKDATCTEEGHDGNTVCNTCGATVSEGEVIAALGHSYGEDGICTGCGKVQSNLEKATSIAIGDQMIIVCESKSMEMQSFNGTSYAYGVAYTEEPAGVYTWTIVAGATEGTFAFQNTEGAYMAWSSSNSLKTSTTLDANSSWNVTFDEAGNAIIANGADATRLLQWNASSPRFACYTTVQTAVQLYKFNTAGGDVGGEEETCEHTYVEEITTAATCTAAGVKTFTCSKCSDTYTEEIAALGHTYGEDGKCTACGVAVPQYNLVTNISALQEGDHVIIVASGDDFALSTTQNNNNRGQQAVTKDGNKIMLVDGIQVLTLEAGAIDGTFAFNTGSGYLYAASSSSNYLRTQATMDENGSWLITIDADGVATIKAQGTNTRNWLRYNSTSSMFSCYASGQKDVAIYKLAPADCQHSNTTTTTVDATCGKDGSVTVTCNECGETVGDVTILPATGEHTYENYVCTVCYKVELAADSELTLAQAAAIGAAMDKDAYTEGKYYVTGQIVEVENTTYGNMTIKDENGNTLYIFGVYSADGSVRYDALETKPVVGDTVTLYGIIGKYNDAQMKNGWITGHEALNCEHTSTTVVGAKDATCTEEGHDGNTVCNTCGATVTEGKVIPALGHKYENGFCSVCGEKETITATITFDDVAKITDFDETSHSIWKENGITVTNSKGGYTNALAKYAKPARFYAKTGLKIEYAGMTEIVFTCNSAAYATTLASTIGSAAVVDGKVVTVKLSAAQDVFEIASFGAQVRMDSITITASAEETPEESTCEHSFVDGVCSACGHKLGDINGDDVLTYEDAVYLLLHTMYSEQYPINDAYADVNGDGSVDLGDAVYLLLHILFGNLFYPLRTPVEG